jgi:DNA-binding winged helix-turn-helix (wHTH) protein
VHFTRTEFDLLWILARHPGQLFTRDQLTALTWGEAAVVARRRVDRHVYFIREKLGRLGAWVETVARKGYRFAAPAPGACDRFVAHPSWRRDGGVGDTERGGDVNRRGGHT